MHSTNDLGDGYCGTPLTHKEKWKWFEWEMEILEFFDTRDEAWEVEHRLIAPDLNNPNCLNESNGRITSIEASSRGGITRAEIHRKQKKGFFDPETRMIGTVAANKVRSRPLVLERISDGELFPFPSQRKASKELGLTQSALSGVVNGTRKSHKGYRVYNSGD